MSATPTPAPDNSNIARTENGSSSDHLLNTLGELTADVQRRMAAEIQSAVDAHAPKFQEIFAKMRESVTIELRESLRQEFQIALQRSLDNAALRDTAIHEEL